MKLLNFQIILLSVIAFALATPIDDKTRPSSAVPDISTLPLKKDVTKDSVNSHSVQQGVQAHPLHKRDAPNSSNLSPLGSANPQVAQPGNVNKPQTANNPKPQQTRQSVNSPNGQKPQSTPLNPSAPRPSTQVNGQQQPVLSLASRVKRDAPQVTDQKNVAAKPTATNTDQKLGQKSPAPTQGSRISRDAPKTVDLKAAPQTASNLDKKPTTSSGNADSSKGSRLRRDAPKATDSKTAPQSASQLPSVANANSKTPVATPVQTSRLSRQTPKVTDPKPAQQSSLTQSQSQAKPAIQTPGASSNKRPVRDAPNPTEQSKIVPSAYQPSQVKNDNKNSDSKSDTSSNPAAAAKSNSPIPHKRESPASNVREPLQSTSSSSNNQSPTFVHPVPVDQILKKPTDAST